MSSEKTKGQRKIEAQTKWEGLPEVWIGKAPGKKGSKSRGLWAKENFKTLLQHGYNYSQAAERLGYNYHWWYITGGKDKEWKAECNDIVSNTVTSGGSVHFEFPDLSQMGFAEFVELYAGFTLAEHQIEMAAALEDPLAKVVLVLGHPESGKSTLISLWYVLFHLAKNPDVRIALVTKNSTKAQDLLTRVKRYLTEEHLYDDAPRNLVTDFGGWKPLRADLEWSQNQIFVRHRRSGERDPSVQALGIGKQIYGSRLDLLILDDALVQDNQTSEITRERIDNWFDGEARSRAQRGQTVVNGTRLLPQDLYGQWKKAWADQPLFRQVIIPAILDEYTEDERVNWKEYWTLDGYDQYEEINGQNIRTGYQMGMRDLRDLIVRKDANRWRLIYQQEDVEEEQAIFRQAHIDAALELGADRKMGDVYPHEKLILGVDPATTGRAAAILLAVNPETRVRSVVDIFVGSNLGATGIRQKLMYYFWDKYGELGRSIDITVVEENFVKTLKGDETLMMRAQAAGTNIVFPHTSGKGRHGKWDEEYGIAAMQALFGAGLMCFPNAGPDDEHRLLPLIDDLMVFPWSEQQDTVMALWVANGHTGMIQISVPPLHVQQNRRGIPTAARRPRV